MEGSITHRAAAPAGDVIKAVKGVKFAQSKLNRFDRCDGISRIGGKKERRFAQRFLRGFGAFRIATDNNYARAILDECARRGKT
jgi:hypothetical protein